MNPTAVKQDFKKRVCEQIDLEQEGENRFRVLTPFRFQDGDHYGIVLKREPEGWVLTDEAHTLMHLSYWLDEDDVESGNRHEILQGSLAAYAVENRGGELRVQVSDERFGDALFDFIQGLTKVSDISFLSRERVRSTFLEDFETFLRSQVSEERLIFNWTDPTHDPQKKYPVDCRINRIARPLFVYALPNENRVQEAMINLLTFERWGLRFQSLGIFEEQESINRRILAKFTDVCDKAFSSLEENKDRIALHLQRITREEP